jgi:hypothetical protein
MEAEDYASGLPAEFINMFLDWITFHAAGSFVKSIL